MIQWQIFIDSSPAATGLLHKEMECAKILDDLAVWNAPKYEMSIHSDQSARENSS